MTRNSITSTSHLDAAKAWLAQGIQVIPLIPGQKRPRLELTSWLAGLDEAKLDSHWQRHPYDDVSILPGEGLVILDADTDQSLAALVALEQKHGIAPSLVVKTRRGQHHYFAVPNGVVVRSNSHSTEAHPERIDVRTGRNQVVIAPSTGKSVQTCLSGEMSDMANVSQTFIDDLDRHNGRSRVELEDVADDDFGDHLRLMPDEGDEGHHGCLRAMLDCLDPEEGGYDLWTKTLMAVYASTNGDDEGLEIADEWSSGGASYQGRRSIETKWRSFKADGGVTLGTIIYRLSQEGLHWAEVCDEAMGEPFEVTTYEVVPIDLRLSVAAQQTLSNPLERFDVCGSLDEIRRYMQDLVPVLPPIAMLGQATAIYAAPNTGKTLLSLHLAIQGVQQGYVDGSNIYYVNCDDSARGIVDKGEIIKAHGIRMLASGHHGFTPRNLLSLMATMVKTGTAKGIVLILDTLKKFTDTMNKSEARDFGINCREFCMNGGTIIALGHINKNRDGFGNVVYSGTTDIVDDFDCMYLVDGEDQADVRRRKVCFINKKHRGGVPMKAAFSYSTADGLTYRALFNSIQNEDEFEVEHQQGAKKPKVYEDDVIKAIGKAIREGVVKKVDILANVQSVTGASRAYVEQVLTRKTGSLWGCQRGERGALIHYIIEEQDLESMEL